MITLFNKFTEYRCGDVAVVVDVLRASTTITTLLSFIDEVYITTSTAKKEENAIYIGERGGAKLKDFDFGNSPTEILANKDIIKERYENGEKVILTTTNGTRVLKSLNAEHIFIGAIVNAKFVANAVKDFENISLVPCHRENSFAIEDFIGCGIIAKYIDKDVDELTKVALELIKHDWMSLILNSSSAQNLRYLGYEKDIFFSMLENNIDAVGVYKKEESKVVRFK